MIVGNSPPEIQAVSVVRNPARPDLATATFSSIDPDGDSLEHHFEWFVDGELVTGVDSATFPIQDRHRGQELAVRVSSSDGELAVSRRSTAAAFQNHPPALVIGTAPQIVESDEARWAELSISATDDDEDPVRIQASGEHASYDASTGILRWPLKNGTEEFVVRLTATDASGATAEQTLRLKR